MNNDSTFNSKLGQFFVNSLHELYWSETHLVTVLNTMADVSTSMELKQAFETHAAQTRQHQERLQSVFELLDIAPDPQPCPGLQGLFDEGWKVINETEVGTSQRDGTYYCSAESRAL